MFLFIASAFLFDIYLTILLVSKEYITFVLNIYSDTNDLMRLDFKLDLMDIGALFLCVLVGVWYLLQRHWITNNIFGVAFSINAIEILHFNKYIKFL